MSEKLFNLLLHLYPARFRREYGEEAVQLFRDRLRDEYGFFPRLRLWADLLVDLGSSLPREYRRTPAALGPSQVQNYSGLPSFHVLEDQPLRPGMFFFGSVLALAALAVFEFLLSHGVNKPLGASSAGSPASTALRSSVSRGSAKHLPGTAEADAAPYQTAQDSNRLSTSPAGATAIKQPPGTPIVGELRLNDVERQLVISGIISNLIDHGPDPDQAQKIADELSTQQNNGAYRSITSGHAFATLLTSEMRDISQDAQLKVVYGIHRIPPDDAAPSTLYQIDDYFTIAIPKVPPMHP